MDNNNIFNIPVYLEAKNKDDLVKKMLSNNMLNGKIYNYQTPYKDGKKWVVWYYAEVNKDKHIDKIKFPGDPLEEIK